MLPRLRFSRSQTASPIQGCALRITMDWPGRNAHITQALFEVTGMCAYLIDIMEFNEPPLGQLPLSGLTPTNDKCSSRAGGMK
jgi:hypothetical protein